MAPQKSARARLLVATQYQVETDAGRRNRSAAVLSATMMPVCQGRAGIVAGAMPVTATTESYTSWRT